MPKPERLERLWTGGRWCEGPAWFGALRTLVWSDIPNDRMLRWDERNGQAAVLREPANNTNGNTVDRQGRLVSCEHLARRVVRTEHDGSITVLASHWQGRRLNSPNDVVVHSDGGVWFTDPSYGILSDYEGLRADSEIGACHVYRIDPASGAVERVADDFVKPNGLAFSPDESLLYIADTGASHDPNGPRHIRRFFVNPDNKSLRGGRCSPNAARACSTASGSTPRAGSGPAPPTACMSTTPTARCWASCAYPSAWPMSASAGPSATACSSAPPPRSTPSP